MITSSRIASGLAAALAALACGASSAPAGWSADPVTVTPTSASIPLVEGCADGAHGTFVAWQEESSTGRGVLRAQHLLPAGDVDPAWPAFGAIACDVLVPRTELVALPDRMGGVYLLWKEGAALYATRLDAGGAVAAGWPARGRLLAVGQLAARPSIIEDGEHGFYAAWVSYAPRNSQVVGVHLGPANTGWGGWPNDTRAISDPDAQCWLSIWPQLAPAPDGGLFVAWASFGVDTSGWTPGRWRLKRLDAEGLSPAGWPAEGLDFGAFHFEYIGDFSARAISLVALAEDGRGGVFLMIGNPIGRTYGATLDTRLYRLSGDGTRSPDWPAGGVAIRSCSEVYEARNPDESYRVWSDQRDGVIVGTPQYYSEGITDLSLLRLSGTLQRMWGVGADPALGFEIAARGDGEIFVAAFKPSGPSHPFDTYASLVVTQSGANPRSPEIREIHPEVFTVWYGDVGLAPTEDGGAVFFWSQVRERVGLFARRFSPAGEIRWVKPRPRARPGMHRLHFVSGEGVRAAFSVPGPGPARFELFDLAGRRLASQPIEVGAEEVAIEGTAALPSGLYFGRLAAGAGAVVTKLVIAR